MTLLEWIFWTCLALGLYPYLGYPALAWALARARGRDVRRDAGFMPMVTVVTAARNEASCIEANVRNKLAQDYPADRLDMIVVSDASDDTTDSIVQRLARETGRVVLLRQEPRQGKTIALNTAVPLARGEVIVFADANSIYEKDAIRKLVSNFADPSVGYVTGKMVYVDRDGSMVGDGCTAYMKYENWLREQETRIGSIVGVDGGVDAARKSLYRPMRDDQLPDFVLPLSVVGQGFRVVYDESAILEEETLSLEDDEFRMRVRVALRALWALADSPELFSPARVGIFAWQLASHKLLRYCSFLPLAVALLAGLLVAAAEGWWLTFAAVVLVCAALPVLAMRSPSPVGRWLPIRLGTYFLLLNVASAVAAARFLRGQRISVWQPRVG